MVMGWSAVRGVRPTRMASSRALMVVMAGARRQHRDAAADRAADLACGRLADIVVFRQRVEG